MVFEDDEVADVEGRTHRVACDADDEAIAAGEVRRDFHPVEFFGGGEVTGLEAVEKIAGRERAGQGKVGPEVCTHPTSGTPDHAAAWIPINRDPPDNFLVPAPPGWGNNQTSRGMFGKAKATKRRSPSDHQSGLQTRMGIFGKVICQSSTNVELQAKSRPAGG